MGTRNWTTTSISIVIAICLSGCGKIQFEQVRHEQPDSSIDVSLPPIEDTTPPTTAADEIYIEAESGTFLGAKPMTVHTSSAASGGMYVTSGQESLPSIENLHIQNPTSDETAEYEFRTPRTQEYIISARIRAPQSNQDSFWLTIDSAPEMEYHTAECIWSKANEWVWTDVRTLVRGTWINVDGVSCLPTVRKTFVLSGGAHTLRIRKRESNSCVDAFVLRPVKLN